MEHSSTSTSGTDVRGLTVDDGRWCLFKKGDARASGRSQYPKSVPGRASSQWRRKEAGVVVVVGTRDKLS